MTLATNGDTTVLAGHYADDGKRGKQGLIEADPCGVNGSGFSWCPPLYCLLAKSAFLDKDDDVLRVDVISLSPRGLQVKGRIWTAELELDLSSSQECIDSTFEQYMLEQALVPSNDDLLAWEPEATVRRIRAAILTELVCHLFASGFPPLVEQIWSSLRLRATEKQLAGSEEIRAYAEAPLEDVLDVERRVHKWKRPIPPSFRSHAQLDDSFASLQHTFALVLIKTVVKGGSLVVARPVSRAAEPSSYGAVFDTARLGDFFSTPRNNFGCRTPTRQYGWFPMNWRLRPTEVDAGFGDTASCQGLVAGNWRLEEEEMSDL